MNRVRHYLADLAYGLCTRPRRALGAASVLATGWMSVSLSLSISGDVRVTARRLEHEVGVHVAALLLHPPAAADRRLLEEFRSAAPEVVWTGLAVLPLDSNSTLPVPPMIILVDEHLASTGICVARDGRTLDAADVQERSAVAMLTEAAAIALSWRRFERCRLRDGRVWVAVGTVAADMGSAVAFLPPASVLVPWSAWADPNEARRLDAVVLRAPDRASLTRALSRASQLLEAPERADWPHQWLTADRLQQRVAHWQRTVAVGTAALGVLALFLGGAALAGRLGSEVRHRRPEIGLRRALGATPQQIATLLIGEAVTLNLAAAVAGWGVAALTAATAHAMGLGIPPVGSETLAVVTGVSLPMATVVAGVPARRAAQIAPAEALRDE